MNKIWLIIKREYLTRVRKRSFILATFLVPLLTIVVYIASILLFIKKDALSDTQQVLVTDNTGSYINKFENSAIIKFIYSADSSNKARKEFMASKDEDYFLTITSEESAVLLGRKKAGVSVVQEIERQMNEINHNKFLLEAGIDTSLLNATKKEISITTKEMTEEGDKESSASLAYIIALLAAFLIETSLTIYASQVMTGVIEEKTNRIVEIVVSSVKPFQLMLGKIIGVGMVGLTQFLLWIILSANVLMLCKGFVNQENMDKVQSSATVMKSNAPGTMPAAVSGESAASFLKAFNEIPALYIIGTFLFYFLTGFFLYSSIFAAMGAMANDDEETHPFRMPILLLLGFTLLTSINVVTNNPDSSLAVWLSIIPFTAPIAMMARIPFGVPAWQLALSMSLMIISFLFMTWLAARIYRVAILMYGKKVSLKEVWKWLIYSK